MSRREFVLVLAVVAPFLALVWFGLSQSAPSPTPMPADEPSSATPAAAPATPLPAAPPPAAPTPPRAVAALPETIDAGEPAELPRALAAPLRAVTPEVIRCFDDQRAHLAGVQRLAVTFTPTADGGFAEVRVPTGGNPYLAACVEDVFEEVHFEPTGLETFRPATHTFVFDPSKE